MFSLLSGILFFFFQAEDGIRDSSVTGVQTCALPISIPAPTLLVRRRICLRRRRGLRDRRRGLRDRRPRRRSPPRRPPSWRVGTPRFGGAGERRVGGGGGCRWAPCHFKKKKI